MSKTHDNIGEHITVIPYYPDCAANSQSIIKVHRLYFWYNNTFHHPINDETITLFLLHVKMFGATVFPEKPHKGCLSINGDKKFEPGETAVSQILYKGDMIYCRS